MGNKAEDSPLPPKPGKTIIKALKDQKPSRLEGKAHDIVVVNFLVSENPFSIFYMWNFKWNGRVWVCVELQTNTQY